MIGKTYSTHLVLSIAVVVSLHTGRVAHAGQLVAGDPHLVEVFTITESPITSVSAFDQQPVSKEIELCVYEIDGIRHIEAKLSNELTNNPEQAKRITLDRIQHMDDQSKTKMQMAAKGLAKAMQYGVDRYPAIVFDGQVVVYGVTDVQSALAHYRVWRREGKR